MQGIWLAKTPTEMQRSAETAEARQDAMIADHRTTSSLSALTNPDKHNDRDTMTRGIGLKRHSIFSDDEGDRQQRRKFVACVAPNQVPIATPC